MFLVRVSPSGERSYLEIEGTEAFLGRAPGSEVLLEHPDVAPVQARLFRQGENWLVEGLVPGPLSVDGRAVHPGEPTLLRSTSRIEVGDESVMLAAERPADIPDREPVPVRARPFEPDQLVMVGELVEVILRLGNRREFFEKVVDALFHTLDVKRALLMVVSRHTGEPRVVASRNEEEGNEQEEIRLSQTILRSTLQESRSQLLANAMASEDLASVESVVSFAIKSVLCVPIPIRGEPAGLLYADNRVREASFDRADLEYLTMIGRLVGVILDDLDRREEEDRRIKELEAHLRDGVEFLHASPKMDGVLDQLRRFAAGDLTVLVTGESGTGKELVARTLHNLSSRPGRFVALNCAAIPEGLLESELFGHERGAFTGAHRTREGCIEAADRGTLFLDEIGEMSAAMQAKLLRAIETHEFTRVGSNVPRQSDVRIVAATHRDLEREVRERRFRHDLLWRIRVLSLAIPPLRERPEDVELLSRHFLDRLGSRRIRIDSDARRALLEHDWPGNVRELKNVLERAAILCPDRTIRLRDLPGEIAHRASTAPIRPLRDVVSEHVRRAFRLKGGNLKATAEALGVARNTVYRHLREEPDAPRKP
jgi:transcriptional regulator with GAF, ATPase, and Fis domain